jgi:hypothetical protein
VAPSRREFLRAAAGALAGTRLGVHPGPASGPAPGPASGAPAVHVARRGRAPADLVVRGGTVFDGTGAPGVEADVVVAGGAWRASRRAPPRRAPRRSTRAASPSRPASSTCTRTPTAPCSPTRRRVRR